MAIKCAGENAFARFLYNIKEKFASITHTHDATDVGAAPTSHASSATTYGAASDSDYGHAMASSTTPKANGTAAIGVEVSKFARGDHAHPAQTSVTGNAGTATKLATARNINGMSVQGDADRVNYGTCSTAAATAAKTVACTGFALITGAEITVKFTVTNTASNPTLNVNSTGDKAIYYRGSAIGAENLAANRTYTFRYNGTQYELVGDINTDTKMSTATSFTSGSTVPDNRLHVLSVNSAITINAAYETSCPVYGSHFVLNFASTVDVTLNALSIQGDTLTDAVAGDTWEISILRGRCIVKKMN